MQHEPADRVVVDVHRAGSIPRPGELEADIEMARKIAQAMDSQFEIAGYRIGWDAIIGLIPVAGDLISGAISLYPLHIARKHKLSRFVQTRIAANIVLDLAVGAVPVAGDVFDAMYKSNLKNLALLEKAAEKRRLK